MSKAEVLQGRQEQAQIVAWGFEPDASLPPVEIPKLHGMEIDTFDFLSGRHDGTFSDALKDESVSDNTKIEIIHRLHESIFETPQDQPLDQKRAAFYLSTATKLYKDKTTSAYVKDVLYTDYSSSEMLQRVKVESAVHRWNFDHVEAAINAYITLQDFEKRFGAEKAAEKAATFSRDLVHARESDKHIAAAGEGNIHLSHLGEELMQIMQKNAFLDITEDFGADASISPYYRGHLEATNSPSRPDGLLMTPKERLLEIAGRHGHLHEGRQLPIFGKVVEEDGDVSIPVLPGTGEVGGPLGPATGYAFAMRLREIRAQGKTWSEPRLGDALRELKLETTGGAVLASLGDGADHFLQDYLSLAKMTRAPIVYTIHNNDKSIGVKRKEIADGELYKIGHGREVPGVQISEDNGDAMYLATEFATEYTLRDAGPIIIETKTPRFAAHSDTHGDATTTELFERAQNALKSDNFLIVEDENGQELREYLDRNLSRMLKGDNQLKLQARLQFALDNLLISPDTRETFVDIVQSIQDPMKINLSRWKEKGYITDEELGLWQKEINEEYKQLLDEVKATPFPDPEEAMKHIRIPTPPVEESTQPKEIVTRNAAGESRAVLEELLQDDSVLYYGVDVIKGRYQTPDTHEFVTAGGYWREAEGIWEKYGHIPGQVMNFPINEEALTQFAMGVAMTTTDTESVNKGFVVILNHGYADYAMHALPAYTIHGSKGYVTNGKITHRVVMLASDGAVPRGGITHVRPGAGIFNQVPFSVDVSSTSDAQTFGKRLRHDVLKDPNPSIIINDKLTYFGDGETYEAGGMLEPGRALVLIENEGGDTIQMISYGPAMRATKEGIQQFKQASPHAKIGLLDLVSIHPLPKDDLQAYLENGSGDIIIVCEEPELQSFGGQLKAWLENPKNPLYQLVQGRGRVVRLEASENVPAFLSDPKLLRREIPTGETVAKVLFEAAKHSDSKTPKNGVHPKNGTYVVKIS